ncbi:hypothetical protein JCM16303_004450, partial [Sporobolomyces ruberrimus]
SPCLYTEHCHCKYNFAAVLKRIDTNNTQPVSAASEIFEGPQVEAGTARLPSISSTLMTGNAVEPDPTAWRDCCLYTSLLESSNSLESVHAASDHLDTHL